MSDLILFEKPAVPFFKEIASAALQARDAALNNAALIGKIENQEQNDIAVRAGMELKRIANMFEKQRKAAKEPFIEAGRQLDRLVNNALAEVEKEAGRISNLAKDFQLTEQRRIYEEQEAQRKEIERIEREKQLELQRIAREQAEREAAARKVQEEIERKAREEREAAEKLAREATNKKQREAAEKARVEAEQRAEMARIESERLAKESQARAAAEFQQAQEAAQSATLAESKPIVAQRTAGQAVKTDWEIIVVNPYELAKFHPDCVKIEPLLTPIKQALNAGITVKGIRAEKKVTVGFRPTQQPAAIEI